MDSFQKADSVINHKGYRNVACSISGGADSDIILDLCHKLDEDGKIQYVWFDTSLEYQATKDHLGELEQRYGVKILRQKPVKSIPACCRQYGQPFLSKFVSIEIERLQRHGFQWEDEPYEVLSRRYDNCVSALKWWCNEYNHLGSDKPSRYSIGRNRWLKEFMIANPPWFPISSKCCHYAKKLTSDRFARENGIDLSIIGVRKAEGGVRAFAYNGCFTANGSRATAEYRPLFWYTNATKAAYDKRFQITHSRCYTEYGMTRTGCAGCPYNRDILKELSIIRKFEPQLYQAVAFIFKDSYGNPQNRIHLTEKPLQLMRDIVKITEPGGRILDPFAGSGTTVLAAVLEGYTATGIEVTEDYASRAAERIGTGLEQAA